MGVVRLVLAGASIGNGNRGVEALGRSVADAVAREAPGGQLTVLDDGWGVRAEPADRHPGARVELAGVRLSRRWHRPESWAQIRVAQAIAPRLNPVARRIAEADAVLDLSAGDSFTDAYGHVRLRMVTEPKQAALRAGRPLVLLPQTYGPFADPRARQHAAELVRGATLAYARDPWSHAQLLDLAGPDADATRLRDGVDVAFALEPRQPEGAVADLLASPDGAPVVGVNVSGLLTDQAAHERFSLVGNYPKTMTALVESLVAAGARVILVPHVHVPGASGESDINAITSLREGLDDGVRSRTVVLPPELSAAEVKWCIARTDWFVGSRMHATIAALSTGTPVAAYAYSDKTHGVFETCGMAEECVDARAVGGVEAVDALISAFERRDRTRQLLAEHTAPTVARSREQMREILDLVHGGLQ